MMLMEYTSIRREYLPDDANNSTWKLLYTYIDAHRQRLIDEYTGYGLKAMTRL